ncbi:MAG: ATP-binding protein [Polyangiaceae bacterium]
MPPSHQAEAEPSRDLAAALHEVSNALTVLLGWVEAARDAATPEAAGAALDVVAARASQARSIARGAIGAATEPEPKAPAGAVVNEAAHALSVEARRANVTLSPRVDAAAAALPVASVAALHQVLTNLVLNALAFSPPGATVRISLSPRAATARPGSPCVLIAVEDEGPGVPLELRDRIFEGGRSERAGGAGIGLRHSAALAVRAGGELRLGAIERGTRFELSWPIAHDEIAPASARRPAVAPPRRTPSGEMRAARPSEGSRTSMEGARILVVEDDDAVIDLLEMALEARGASVVSVRSRTDLPRALRTGAFDAVLLDMSPLLGDVDGAVTELVSASPAARLVVMSGSVPTADIGAAAVWVRKPFEVREIVEALADITFARQTKAF